MGGVVDAVGGLFGVDGGGSVDPLKYRPYGVTSALGQTSVDGRNVQANLSPELQGLFEGLVSQAGQGIPAATSLMGDTGLANQSTQQVMSQVPQFQQQAQDLLGRAQNQFSIANDPQSAIAFQRQAYGDELDRQRLSQESRLYNQGLLGSTTGSLQQEATREAQNDALMQGAQRMQQQAFQQGSGLLGQAMNYQQMGLGALNQAQNQDLASQQFQANLQNQARNQQLGLLEGR